MSGILGKQKAPPPPPAPTAAPQIDDATAKMNEADKASRRQGRKATFLTGDSGLPDLGTTTILGQ